MSFKQDDIDYPREFFAQMILKNSPYAFYLFQWIDYENDAKRWRLKMAHDLKLKDGRILEDMYPNANAWTGLEKVSDDQVSQIRISRKLAWGAGEWVDERNT